MPSTQLRATQQVRARVVRILDRFANPAVVENPAWSVSEQPFVTVTQDPLDPLAALVRATGVVPPPPEPGTPPAAALVTFQADADLGEGIRLIMATGDVIVVGAGEATIVEFEFGPPEEQPLPA